MTAAQVVRDLREVLRNHGFTPVKSELWAEFVVHVIEILQSAANQLQRSENWEVFKQKRGALGAPRRRARRKVIERLPIEDAITSELGHIVHHLRRTVPRDHFLRLNEVEFHVEALVPSPLRAGRHSRKIDFLVYAAVGIDEPELAIEAKPIAVESDITGRYLADEGIGCFFTTDSPYTQAPLGAMLAYTLNNDGRSWKAAIRAAIASSLPLVLSVEDTRVASNNELITVSRHERDALGLAPIAILHLEMLFAPDEEAFNGPVGTDT